MVVQSEKRLLWHPRRDNKFIVGGGSTIILYEWALNSPEIRHVTSQHDLSLMKCFAWSPDPIVDDLVAVGLSNGTVDLMRLEATKFASHHVLSSGPRVSLPVRNSRPCNTLAFCATHPSYLAVGLDKIRSDPSLIIWDIQSSMPTLNIDATRHLDNNSESPTFRSQNKIPRGDVGQRMDERILQQHALTDFVSSVAFLPHSPHLLLAGISHRWLRLFDLRSPMPSTTNVASKVHGIATDPFDPYRIGTFGDGTVTIWDSRRLPHPLLTFTMRDASADGGRPRSNSVFTTIEFSSTRRGVLATLEKDASHVRFWDLQRARSVESSPEMDRPKEQAPPNRTPRLSWASPSSMLSWTGTSSNQAANEEARTSPFNLVLADTRKTRNFSRHVASFALVPSSDQLPLTSNVMVVNKEGDLELYAIHDNPKYAPWSSRGDLTVGCGKSYRILSGFEAKEIPPEPWDIPIMSTSTSHPVSPLAQDLSPDAYLQKGRRQSKVGAPLFGRGDEDGFPALGTSMFREPANITATRQSKRRTYSPASFRGLRLDTATPTGDGISKLAGFTSSTFDHAPQVISESSSRHVSHREKSASRGRKHTNLEMVHNMIENDISMTMRRRVIQGYGLPNAYHNWYVTQEDPSGNATLSELWAWIHHSRQFLSSPASRLHGYDFSFQGLRGIWDGFAVSRQRSSSEDPSALPGGLLLDVPPPPHLGIPLERSTSRSKHLGRRTYSPADALHGDFYAAVAALGSGRNTDQTMARLSVTTTKLVHRQLSLQLCGWSLREEDLTNAVKKWEKEDKHSQAACWLVFTGQHSKALELLMRSKDETHHIMTGILAALIPQGSGSSSRNTELREHAERLLVRLHDPYFRAMLTHLTSSDWSEVLEEEAIPLRERLAIAFQFLDDPAVSAYLRRTAERAITRGDIEGIVITGLTPAGIDILQNYLNITGDVQTAAILSSYVCPSKFQDTRTERWLEAYRDMLDGWKLFHQRCQFDIDRGEILKQAVESEDMPRQEWVPRQILLRCNYCSKSINVSDPTSVPKSRTTACPYCKRALPRCSICLMTLAIVPDGVREAELAQAQFKDTVDDAIVMCQTCRHGGHASHILDWFYGEDGSRSNGVCAVSDCDCHCADEF
ncbi:hypothetical protein JAAARDRAFT_180432 [Jaapia argillacea MUCL 33604]|uniref:Uncharacterized protein n=1 Tax=Jaapia argillacea MUCL 33604 TaxID=933084 RepID=A0A067PWK7_9AGAM|nr:hypothetical protein JAAARDRAFT_180432 [Jaapia argillacea MUCL 33604]